MTWSAVYIPIPSETGQRKSFSPCTTRVGVRKFRTKRCGAVWVDSRALVEALRHVYGARFLADELTRR